jgi:hypothetical protein
MQTILFTRKNEILCGRNEAPPEADSSDTTNGYESENHLFSFCQSAQGSRKTAQCCLENLRVRTTLRQTAVNSHPECFQTKYEKLYESEKRTELIQTTYHLVALPAFVRVLGVLVGVTGVLTEAIVTGVSTTAMVIATLATMATAVSTMATITTIIITTTMIDLRATR